MAIGNALAAAVNGFIGGRDVRNSWEDRKINQQRQKRLDELREKAEVRAEESHDLDMETGGLLNTARRQAIRSTDQDWSDDRAIRAAGEADLALAEGAMRTPRVEPVMSPASVSTSGSTLLHDQIAAAQEAATAPAIGAIRTSSGPTPQTVADQAQGQGGLGAFRPAPAGYAPASLRGPASEAGAGVSVAADPAPFAQTDAAIMRAATAPARDVARGPSGPAMGAIPERAPVADFLRLRPDGKVIANRPPQTAEEQRALIEAAKSGKLATSEARVDRQQAIDADTAQGLPYEWGTPGNAANDASRAAAIGGKAVRDVVGRTGEMLANQAIGAVQGINAPFQAASRYITGEDKIGAPQRVDLTGDGKSESMATPLAESWGAIRSTDQPTAAPKHAPAAAGQAAPETAQKVSEAAANSVNAVAQASPGVKSAIEAIPAKSLGVSRSAPMTKPQREKAGQTLMDSYLKTGAPNTVRALLRQGKFDQAEKFDTWIKDRRAAEGMQSWGRGIFAALQGDADGAADAFMDAYNSAGYFDDGMDVVKDKSAVIKNEAGDVVGVTLTLRDQATGEEVTQTDSIEGFIEKAAWITSPEKAFEASQARLQAQQEALLKADERRRASAEKLVTENYTQTISLARDMFAKSQASEKAAREAAMLTGKADDVPPAMTWDEAFREAQRIMVDGPADSVSENEAAAPPIARRPQ